MGDVALWTNSVRVLRAPADGKTASTKTPRQYTVDGSDGPYLKKVVVGNLKVRTSDRRTLRENRNAEIGMATRVL